MARFPSAFKVGGSLIGLTVRSKPLLTLAAFPSVTVRVMWVRPNWFATGVIAQVRLTPLPPSRMLLLRTRLVFEEVAVTVRLVAAVSTSPTVNGTAPVFESSSMVWLGRVEMVGRSLTEVTVRRKLVLAERKF